MLPATVLRSRNSCLLLDLASLMVDASMCHPACAWQGIRPQGAEKHVSGANDVGQAFTHSPSPMCRACPAAHCLPQRLLAQLRTNPLWYQEQLWAGLFGFAVSCQYLGAAEHLDLQQVVTHQLLEFCHHLTGLGITGAWHLPGRGVPRSAQPVHALPTSLRKS